MENYEQKYKEALERARLSRLQLLDIGEEATEIEYIFPELKESEDERIRTKLLNLLKELLELGGVAQDTWSMNDCEQFIAWLDKQGDLEEKPTRDQVWEYCSKISHEWWQMVMTKWNTLTDEEQSKYNQFIGFNDFSDMLMNITAGALFQLIDTGKLEYEEGSLLLEKPDDTSKPLEVVNAINKKQGEQKPTDKVEPKFKVGDCIRHKGTDECYRIVTTDDNYYFCENNHAWAIKSQDYFELVEQKPNEKTLGGIIMTREEEIKIAANKAVFDTQWDNLNEIAYNGFIEGAKWADKTLLDKACKWLMKNIVTTEVKDIKSIIGEVNYYTKDNRKVLISMFRKAMED